ncbi:MBL fold metallo-hydrolase [Halobacteriales archaeon QS_1_68_17]|nr:MAG: MBL fold metallo-hydrolase [Halobacteriales archaeon QS_1_68_17]
MARQLREGVWLLELGWMRPLATRAYLVDDGEVTLIDAGMIRNATPVGEELAAAGYDPADVDRVLVTHYDLDHTGGLSRLVPELDAPVYIGEADARLVAGDWSPPVNHKGFFHRAARRLFPLPESLPVRHVGEGDGIGGFRAYHTPGHNPGHTVYVHEDGVALLGDLVWEEDGELTPPIWFDSYDVDQIHESIRSFARRVAPFDLAAVAHGDPILSGGYDALRRLADRL